MSAEASKTKPNVPNLPVDPELAPEHFAQYQVIKRSGKLSPFEPRLIAIAISKAFMEVEGIGGASIPSRIYQTANEFTKRVIQGVQRHMQSTGKVHIEDIQDQVELVLMRAGEHKIARAYVLYREQHARARAARGEAAPTLNVTCADGRFQPLDHSRLHSLVTEACTGIPDVAAQEVIEDSLKNLFDGIPEQDVGKVLIMSARMLIEREPNYSYVAARLLLDMLRGEALSFVGHAPGSATAREMAGYYPEYFALYLKKGVEHELLSPALAEFDLARLTAALRPERDLQFTYLGLQTLYDRYFLHWGATRFELPQAFFMRVAMGLAMNEIDREQRAIEFYNLLSSFDFMSSTPTLFNSGTLRPQLSSCYLTTVPDDLHGIYMAIHDNALLSKFAGGLGNDWTRVRAMGARIKGTNGISQGVVPFMKVANDTAVAVNQCFAPDTLVYTADGVKSLKEIQRGDLVLGQRGEYREVLEKMTYLQDGPMVEVEVKHSIAPLRVTAGHPFWAIQGVPDEQAIERTLAWLEKGKVRPAWVDAGHLRKSDYLAQVIPQETVPVTGLGEDDARLYGILLGDGHLSKNGREWGVSGNPRRDTHLAFVREYLRQRGIHCWETGRGETYLQIHWAAGRGAVRDGTTGRIVGAGEPTLPFAYEDLYDAHGDKRIARRFSHLPHAHTLALLRGLLETDGGVSRGTEIYFTTTSRGLAEGVRYQCLRLGVPVAGQYREREQDHHATRSDGSQTRFLGTLKAYDLRIPAVPELARLTGCRPLTKHNWFVHKNWLFSRVRRVEEIAPLPVVYDLKVEGDESYMTTAALAHNGGKRKGAVCAYLETWHLDIEEFLELRKNTGDERRRTHDMNTANWVPDLFMQRVHEDAEWTLFSPDEAADLHELYGQAFAQKYQEYEAKAARGEIKVFKKVSAVGLWRKMLTMLFETGHPWITFKDPMNLRSPQRHAGTVHSSNLCTEISLNTSDDEIAVCNLGSINLPAHIGENGLNLDKLQRTVKTAMRMLDNVIDINYYTVPQARRSNLRHRPVGLGIMGFQDALYLLRVPYTSDAAVEFADRSMEAVSYYAIQASSELAEERGRYSSFDGSLWSQGVLPIDSLEYLRETRGAYLDIPSTGSGHRPSTGSGGGGNLDWDSLRQRVKQAGMRNSNCMAIAPTATISNICGVSQSIEPTFQNLYVKSNLSGEFTVVNPYLVRDLKALGLWDEGMVNDLKYFDGSVQQIERVPEELKALYATAFEIDPAWLVDAAARRQKWLDQAQSLNLYMREPSGKKLDALYKLAWLRGLKTTYYLRSQSATSVEKNTVQHDRLLLGVTPPPEVPALGLSNGPALSLSNGKACAIDDPDCEACQ